MLNSSGNSSFLLDPFILTTDDVLTQGAELQSRRKSQSAIGTQVTSNVSGSTGNGSTYNYTNRAIISFVDAIDRMNEEVLVPSRLRDLEVRETDVTEMLPVNADLYSYYQLLNTVKTDLFSSSLYYKTFRPISSGQNSGQNSGRVTPTFSRSRRSSYSLSNTTGATTSTTASTTTTTATNRTSPTLLTPPTNFDRKMSSPCLMGNGECTSPPVSTTITNDFLLPPGQGFNQPFLLPQLSLSYVSRQTSLSSLLNAVNNLTLTDSNATSDCDLPADERVQQITSCFLYHLSALYTIMGHFTKTAQYITKRYHEQMENLG